MTVAVPLRSHDSLSCSGRGRLLCGNGDRDSDALGLGNVDCLIGDIIDGVDLQIALEDGTSKCGGSQGGSSDEGGSAHDDSLSSVDCC